MQTVKADHTVILYDQINEFNDLIQIYRNDTISNTWEKQVNVSQGNFNITENRTYIFQLQASSTIVAMDIENDNWGMYQIFWIMAIVAPLLLSAMFFTVILIFGFGWAIQWFLGRRK